ncbi:hypothetical protein RHMOL_Rhmol11G0010900 [Rhododendron molle]|uniref:Uncharacterized protein n=1 Tax=Rhododendron molle TaxID=49168 RepID=A0ACC0LMF1_RHOML|nr:hypothetical protein RHMOL_Rhmol11G0010900 [Rhododendron molle]
MFVLNVQGMGDLVILAVNLATWQGIVFGDWEYMVSRAPCSSMNVHRNNRCSSVAKRFRSTL